MNNIAICRVLKRYGPILHKALTNPRDRRSGHGHVGNYLYYNNRLASAVKLTSAEVSGWDLHYKVFARLQEMISSFQLFLDAGFVSGGYRINLEEVVYNHGISRVTTTSDLTFHMVPYAYVGYSWSTTPYNSFIQMRLHVKQGGKWVLSKIPGTGVHHNDKSVFSPLILADMDFSFNLTIDLNKPNSVKADDTNRDTGSIHGCALHHLDQIDSVAIPNDARLRFAFWQLSRIMRPVSWLYLRRALF